jgi:hypothetical protein
MALLFGDADFSVIQGFVRFGQDWKGDERAPMMQFICAFNYFIVYTPATISGDLSQNYPQFWAFSSHAPARLRLKRVKLGHLAGTDFFTSYFGSLYF